MKRLVPLAAGVAIGAVLLGYGVIWASSNRGRVATVSPTASPRPTPTSTPGTANLLSTVDFVTPEIGWAVSGSTADPGGTRTIYRTIDGGRHWTAQNSWYGPYSMGRDNLLAIQLIFIDDRRGFVLDPVQSPPALYRTTDGGSTWEKLDLPTQLAPGWPLTFVDPDNGFLLADVGAAMGQSAASVYRTSDGGRHWTRVAHVNYNSQSAGLSSNGDKDGLIFRTTSVGWMTAYSIVGPPPIWSTFDGGLSWTEENLPIPQGVYFSGNGAPDPPIFFSSQQGAFPIVVTLVPTPNGQPMTVPAAGYPSALYVYPTSDGGRHWLAPRRLPALGSLTTPLYWQLLDANHWWVGAGDHLWFSRNAGQTWTELGLGLPSGYTPVTLNFRTADVGYALAVSARPGSLADASLLLKTTDAGIHWTVVPVPNQ
jgi:photosystem II stability/assembly factor-like uncharacterized protein